MLTHKTIFTHTPQMVTIGLEIVMTLLIQETETKGDPGFLMRATFKTAAGTGRRGISSRVIRLHTVMSHRVGARWTTPKMVLSGVLHLLIGEEGSWRRTEAKDGTTVEIAPKGIVGGKVTMVGKRGNATDTAKMTARSRRRNDLGNLDLGGILVESRHTVTNGAEVGGK